MPADLLSPGLTVLKNPQMLLAVDAFCCLRTASVTTGALPPDVSALRHQVVFLVLGCFARDRLPSF